MTKVKSSVLAKLLMCSGRWIRDLTARNILPAPVRGFFNLEECVPKYIAFLKSSSPNLELQKLKAQHLHQRIAKLELETKLVEKSLVPVTYAQEVIEKAVAALKLAFKTLPWTLAHALIQIRRCDDSDEIYEKWVASIIDRAIQDVIRHEFLKLPRGTPLVQPWEWELVKIGIIEPDKNGNVRYADTKGTRIMKAEEVVAHAETVVKMLKDSGGQG